MAKDKGSQRTTRKGGEEPAKESETTRPAHPQNPTKPAPKKNPPPGRETDEKHS
jgi:hypothetical protein